MILKYIGTTENSAKFLLFRTNDDVSVLNKKFRRKVKSTSL